MRITKRDIRALINWILSLNDNNPIDFAEIEQRWPPKQFSELLQSSDYSPDVNKIDIKNEEQAVKIIKDEYRKHGEEVIARFIYKIALYYTPIYTGNLRESSRIEINNATGHVRIVYTAEYAKYVHEILENRHMPPTRAKFLEDAAYYVYNILQEDGESPLFTFQFGTEEDGSIWLEINSLDAVQFIKNRNQYLDKGELDFDALD